MQNSDPLFGGGANEVSLSEARENYAQFGACEERFLSNVRPPTIDEILPLPSSPDPERRRAIDRGVRSAIVQIAESILSGHIAVLEGCSMIASLAFGLQDSEELLTFLGVAGEVCDVPTGETRKLWDPEALALKEAEAAEYGRLVAPVVFEECRALIAKFRPRGL